MFAPRLLTFDIFGTVLLDVAHRLGLTTVFVRRPHARPGQADHMVSDLLGLATLVEELP